MRLIILSGLSGAGKSVALHMLEDLGLYCVDNMPAAMLKPFVELAIASRQRVYDSAAIGLDARNAPEDIASVPALVEELRAMQVNCAIVCLIANDDALLRRFSETKRRHPLLAATNDLRAAIAEERRLIEPILYAADLVIDTSRMGVHELRETILKRVEQRSATRLSLSFESFGFKDGLPGDADFVFDARTLPNPYWDPALRALTGRDPEVVRYLDAQPAVRRLLDAIGDFVAARIPEHEANNRRYLTIAIGCTGGQHRSVYLVDKLAERFAKQYPGIVVRHTALPKST
ncbi:MAG: RNase adapter RapZ [Steroidobacteraceae bacterium]|nr:RNase adapter RapZ [Steroidobacteraceae bacterium]MDW8257913.1 RNase adapter RapZ [Gammaproteobacteria bacterium]